LAEPKSHTAIVGTERLGRPFTHEERARFSQVLRANDFVGASMVALRFACKLRHNHAAAEDLLSRARLRLVRFGWDPDAVTLVKLLCRFVWSEHTHELEETATARRAEEVFLRSEGIGTAAPSPEDLVLRFERERQDEEMATRHIDALRAIFEDAEDDVNLLWLKYRLDDVDESKEMARLSGRDVMEFYRATERRNRHVLRLLAALGGAKYEEEDT
jgi:hypothetical protein